MNWIISFINSSLGKKLIMALTGLFLTIFLIVHLIGNLQLLKPDSGYAFNSYAVFMTTNPFIKFTSYGLYAIILLHGIRGLMLSYSNMQKRKNKYVVVPGNETSSWASRWMGVLGTLILVFIVLHMAGFWFKYKFGEVPYTQYTTNLMTGEVVSIEDISGTASPVLAHKKMLLTSNEETEVLRIKDLNLEVVFAFKNPLIVIFYVFSMMVLAFHLWHGFRSAFQTLGINHPKYNGLIKAVGIALALIVPFLFALIPVVVYFS